MRHSQWEVDKNLQAMEGMARMNTASPHLKMEVLFLIEKEGYEVLFSALPSLKRGGRW